MSITIRLGDAYFILFFFLELAQENGTISEGILKDTFSATEDNFLSLVRRAFAIKPLIAAVGSCCLVGVIWKGTLHIANLGDSRAVLGSVGRSKKVVAEQLTTDHNASVEEVRQELRSLHPDDSQVVVMKDGVWRIKGIIQVSRSIGDAYLKRPEFSIDPSFPRFHLAKPLKRPVLQADPSLCTRILQPNDKFIIFASDGLWEFLSNQEAVEIVYNNPRMEIARRLIRSALAVAAKKRNISYDCLKKYEKGDRRSYHDDISVVVLFIDHEMLENQVCSTPGLSIRGFVDAVGPSNIQILDRIHENVKPAVS